MSSSTFFTPVSTLICTTLSNLDVINANRTCSRGSSCDLTLGYFVVLILSLYLFKSSSHSYCRPIKNKQKNWCICREDVYVCSTRLPLWLQVVCSSTIPSTSHGPSPPLSSIWDPRISSLTSRGGGASDLWSPPAAGPNGRTHRSLRLARPCWGNREKTGVKGSFDQASRDARSSSFSYFLFLSFLSSGLGTVTSEETQLLHEAILGLYEEGSAARGWARLSWSNTPELLPFFRANGLTFVLTWDDVNVPRGVRPHTALQ